MKKEVSYWEEEARKESDRYWELHSAITDLLCDLKIVLRLVGEEDTGGKHE